MRILLIICLQFVFFLSFAQRVEISGVVTNDRGDGLSYVTIISRPKTNAVVTDKDGRFSIKVYKNDSLFLTHVGCSEFHYGVVRGGFIKIQLDRIPFLAAREREPNIYFFKKTVFGGKVTSANLNDETIRESEKLSEEKRIFTKVEIYPSLTCKEPSISSALLKNCSNKLFKSEGVLRLQFLITKSKTLDSVVVLKSYKKELDERLIKNLRDGFSCFPAVQNGHLVDALCEVELKIKKINKNVSIEVVVPD